MFEFDWVLSYIKVARSTTLLPTCRFPIWEGIYATSGARTKLRAEIELSCGSCSRRWEVVPCRIVRVESDAKGVSGEEYDRKFGKHILEGDFDAVSSLTYKDSYRCSEVYIRRTREAFIIYCHEGNRA